LNFFHTYISRKGWITLFLVILISLFTGWRAGKLKFDYDFESFFPKADGDLDFYTDFRKHFEYDNEFLLIGIENKAGIFKKDFLLNLRSLTDSLSKLRQVERVMSPTNLKYTLIGPLGTAEFPYLDADKDTAFASDSLRIFNASELMGSFFAKDGYAVSIFLKTAEGISRNKSDTLLFQIEKLLHTFSFEQTHLAGKIKAQQVYLQKIRSEFIVFFFCSLALVIFFLFISFRSFWGVWVPLLVVVLAIVWTLGLMNLCGKELDIMSVLLPTMIFVVGMSDAVHIMSKYLEEMRSGKEKKEAMVMTMREVGFPTFLTLITTAIGFLTLLVSGMKPIRDFGIYTSAGVLISFILAYTLLPFILVRLKKPALVREGKHNAFWENKLGDLFAWIMKHKSFVTISTICVVILSILGISRIVQNNNLLEQMNQGDKMQADFHFFDTRFSGVRPFEMVIKAPLGKSVLDPDLMISMDKLENYLRSDYGVGFILSPVTVEKALNKALHGGESSSFCLPEKKEEQKRIQEELHKRRKTKALSLYLSADGRSARISGKMRDVGSLRIRQLDENLNSWIHTQLGDSFAYKPTGGAVLVDKHNDYLVQNMLQGLALSIFAVGFVILLIHRSLKMVVISIVPNLIPILIIGGFMGFAGIDLKSSTSIIFSIAFGIATDDTIHFLGRLKLELNKGLGIFEATRKTYVFTGKAVVVTSLILSAGFLTLITSGFQSTFYFGLLVSLTLLVAVFVELLLFPLLVVWLYGGKDNSIP
jgi:predicted RND superfamily exporter protein